MEEDEDEERFVLHVVSSFKLHREREREREREKRMAVTVRGA